MNHYQKSPRHSGDRKSLTLYGLFSGKSGEGLQQESLVEENELTFMQSSIYFK